MDKVVFIAKWMEWMELWNAYNPNPPSSKNYKIALSWQEKPAEMMDGNGF